jgi:class 3 adenylate cyclase
MEAPIKYAKSGDVHLAYRVFGEGPRDIVLIPGTLSHVEALWERSASRHLLDRLRAFARVIVFDKRGQGLSDRVAAAEQTLEERISDVRAVMDAAGSERAMIYGWSEGGPMCLMFCATYPERVSSLGLYGTFASIKDPPWSQGYEEWERKLSIWTDHWGEGNLIEFNAPSLRNDRVAREGFAQIERASASPGNIRDLMRANYQLDVRHVLPVISAPTLILHRVGDALVPVECGRYLAQHIPGAKFQEIPGTDHTILDNPTQDVVADYIEEFLTGARHTHEPDRVLATVMFTDIVGSTQRASEIGDSRWRELRDNWYALMRKELTAFRGREVDTAGDGLLATFDGPARAIRCASSIRDRVHALGLQVRSGLHTGECELSGDNVVGIAVHIGARVAALAEPDEVLVSSTVKDLVGGSGLKFGDRGAHSLKGVPDEWRLFALQ